MQGRGFTLTEFDLASTLGFQGVLRLKRAEDISATYLPTDQDVAKDEDKLRIKREVGREERLVVIGKTNEKKPTYVPSDFPQDGGTLFPCEICGKHFKSKRNVELHLKTHNQNESELNQCPTCSKMLANKAALAGHIRSHENNFESKSHKSNSELRVAADRVLCNVCSKTYLNKRILNAHLLTHDVDQVLSEKLACTVCPKSFRNKYTLKYHLKSHNGEADQMCSLCSKMFAAKCTLNKHILNMHTENKLPVTCANCGMKCKISSLSRHEKLCKLSVEEREARKVKCSKCEKTLSSRGKLRSHIRVKHIYEQIPQAV